MVGDAQKELKKDQVIFKTWALALNKMESHWKVLKSSSKEFYWTDGLIKSEAGSPILTVNK